MVHKKVCLNDVINNLWDVYNKYNDIRFNNGPKTNISIQEIMNDLAKVIGVLPGQRNGGQKKVEYLYYL